MNRLSYKFWFLIGFLILVIVSILSHFIYEDRRIEQFEKFNNSYINGTLTDYSMSSGFYYITIKNEKYVFNPSSSEVNNKINIGDSIYKPAFSDTIVICYKKIDCKKYTFKEYD